MDTNRGEFGKLIQDNIAQQDIAIEAANDPRRNWQILGSSLSHIEDAAGKASYFLWTAPQEIQAKAANCSSFVSAINSVHGFASGFLAYRNKHQYSTEDALLVASAKQLLQFFQSLADMTRRRWT